MKNSAKKKNTNQVDYQYKGPGRRKAYFEGWYFKLSLDEETTLSLIPSLHQQGAVKYASLQWILAKGSLVTTGVKVYPRGEFKLKLDPFQLDLGRNSFEETRIRIREEDLQLTADFLAMDSYTGNIMGPFTPFHEIMPCSHGLLVTNGQAQVTVQSESLSGKFDSRVYVEKDWGDTFPQRYIWIQADFPDQNASLFFSIATVQVGPIGFTGFIANLTLDGKNHTFATWNLAHCRVQGIPTDIRIGLGNSSITLALRVLPQNSARLNSPVQGMMESTVRESLAAPLELRVREPNGREIKFTTKMASVECHNWFQEPTQEQKSDNQA